MRWAVFCDNRKKIEAEIWFVITFFFHLFVIPLFSIEWRIHEENVSQFNQRRRRAQHRELSLRSVVMQRFTIRSLRDESKGRENRSNGSSSSQSRREARNEESKLLNQPTNEWIKNGSERVGIYGKKSNNFTIHSGAAPQRSNQSGKRI